MLLTVLKGGGGIVITKAVIPAAGLGTRMLPLTKTQPKEMLPLANKPCIQYIIEELASVGVKQILIITGQKKRAIEDHFDKDMELNRSLSVNGHKDLLKELEYEDMDVQFFYTRQSVAAGLGDAIKHAHDFINNEPFIIALGDSVITSQENKSLLERMIDVHEDNKSSFVLGTRQVPLSDVNKYGIVKPKSDISQGILEIEDVIEKPSMQTTPSTLAFTARYIMPANIMDVLERTRPGKGGEIQLTDAIRLLVKEGAKGYAVTLTKKEKRYDIGNMYSYYEAFMDFSLNDDKYGYKLKQYIIDKFDI